MKHVYCPKGKIIYQEGSFGSEFHIILMGKVSVYINDPSKAGIEGELKKRKKQTEKCFEKANQILEGTYEFMKMKAGEAFGESSLVYDRPLRESTLCITNCHFAILTKQKFEEILKKIELKTRDGWKNFFKNHPFFDDLTLVSLEKLFYLVELKFFTRNHPIFKEGDEVKGFYLIYSGEVSLTKTVKTKIQKKIDIKEYYKNKGNIEEGNFNL